MYARKKGVDAYCIGCNIRTMLIIMDIYREYYINFYKQPDFFRNTFLQYLATNIGMTYTI